MRLLNWQRGIFRAWIVFSVLWAVGWGATFFYISTIPRFGPPKAFDLAILIPFTLLPFILLLIAQSFRLVVRGFRN
jgi:hypothetical protein